MNTKRRIQRQLAVAHKALEEFEEVCVDAGPITDWDDDDRADAAEALNGVLLAIGALATLCGAPHRITKDNVDEGMLIVARELAA